MSHPGDSARSKHVSGHELFPGPVSRTITDPSSLSPAHLVAYVEALEARCNMLWGYIQGYDCSCDPVVSFLATELGVTVAHAVDPDSGPAAD